MKVKELRGALKDMADDMEVILQRDPEGNGYGPLHGAADDCLFVERSQEVYTLSWSYEDADFDTEEEWEAFKKKHVRVCVLWPSH